MSKIYAGDNPNKSKSRVYLITSIIVAIPLIAYFYLYAMYRFHFQGIGHLLPLFIFGFPSSILFSKYKILKAGLKGESETMDCLKLLDDRYTIFTNVPISIDGKETEIDNLVIGNNGVFIIEVKNHNGTIEGNGNEDFWVQHKVGQKGGEYEKKMKNPIKQVKYQTFLFSKFLKSNNINIWIEDVVYFSNKKASSRVFNAEKVFFNSNDLLRYIQEYKSQKQLNNNESSNIITILKNQKIK